MAAKGRVSGWLRARLRGRAARAWAALAADPAALGRGAARGLRDEARGLQRDLRRFLRATAPRSAAARATLAGLPLPAGTDWRWRPDVLTDRTWRIGHAAPVSGQRLGQDLRLWHDGLADPALILRQVPNVSATDLAPFGLSLEALDYAGANLKLSFDLPDGARTGLNRGHILRAEMHLQSEAAQPLAARLTLAKGPNSEELRQPQVTLAAGRQVVVAEFEMQALAANPERPDRMWIDLTLPAPRMNALVLRDLILSRHPRAEV